MADILDLVDVQELRNEVQKKYRDVAEKPDATYHFHTGRQHAIRLGYDQAILDQLPDQACEAFAGMANPFYWETPRAGERVVQSKSMDPKSALPASRILISYPPRRSYVPAVERNVAGA